MRRQAEKNWPRPAPIVSRVEGPLISSGQHRLRDCDIPGNGRTLESEVDLCFPMHGCLPHTCVVRKIAALEQKSYRYAGAKRRFEGIRPLVRQGRQRDSKFLPRSLQRDGRGDRHGLHLRPRQGSAARRVETLSRHPPRHRLGFRRITMPGVTMLGTTVTAEMAPSSGQISIGLRLNDEGDTNAAAGRKGKRATSSSGAKPQVIRSGRVDRVGHKRRVGLRAWTE